MSNALLPFGIRPPLVSYTNPNRASLVHDSSESSEPMGKRKKSGSKPSKSRKIRVVKGRVQLRVQGYSGVQHIPSSHLIRYIPSSKLRFAAKKVLKQLKGSSTGSSSSGKKGRKGKKKQSKRRKSKKKKKKKSRKGRKGRKRRKRQ